jgi:hypothetical protein
MLELPVDLLACDLPVDGGAVAKRISTLHHGALRNATAENG